MSIVGRTSNIVGNGTTVDPLLGIFPNKLDNVLKDFESVTYRMSFGCVSREEYDSASYLNDGLQDQRALVIGESGYTGAPVNAAAASTGEAIPNVGNRVVTQYGAPEFFVDNLKFTHYMPGARAINTGLAKVTFDVEEPYSMGLFFNSMLGAAFKKGHTHFSSPHCCYVMKIDFFGHKNGAPKRVPQATKYIPLRVANISFTANESGSKYSVTCLEFGTSNPTSNVVSQVPNTASFDIITDDVSATISGIAIGFNNHQQRLTSGGQQRYADTYIVQLGDISNVRVPGGQTTNPPGWEDMEFDIQENDPGNRSYINPDDYDPSNVNLRLATGGRRFIYNGSADGAQTTIFTVIDDVMCHTTYARTARENTDSDGYFWWWTIQVRQRASGPPTEFDAQTGRRPTTYIYTIVPYRVRGDQFRAPSAVIEDSVVTHSKIRKVFSYMYTGQNDDIISYDMNFNNLFYLATNVRSWDQMRNASDNPTVGETELVPANAGEGDSRSLTSLAASYFSYPDVNAQPAVPGGAGVDSSAIMINRWLNGLIIGGRNREGNNTNLVQLELKLKITGDPYFIPVGGFGNQTETNDLNSMAWEGEQVRIYVRFRTIVDAPQNGSSLYIQRLNGQRDHPFSGVYRLMKVVSTFSDGQFVQELQLYRDNTVNPEVEQIGVSLETAAAETSAATTPLFVGDAVPVPEQAQNLPNRGGTTE